MSLSRCAAAWACGGPPVGTSSCGRKWQVGRWILLPAARKINPCVHCRCSTLAHIATARRLPMAATCSIDRPTAGAWRGSVEVPGSSLSLRLPTRSSAMSGTSRRARCHTPCRDVPAALAVSAHPNVGSGRVGVLRGGRHPRRHNSRSQRWHRPRVSPQRGVDDRVRGMGGISTPGHSEVPATTKPVAAASCSHRAHCSYSRAAQSSARARPPRCIRAMTRARARLHSGSGRSDEPSRNATRLDRRTQGPYGGEVVLVRDIANALPVWQGAHRARSTGSG